LFQTVAIGYLSSLLPNSLLNGRKLTLGFKIQAQVVEINGSKYSVNGVNARARKYPINLKNLNTGMVDKKCSASMIRAQVSNGV